MQNARVVGMSRRIDDQVTQQDNHYNHIVDVDLQDARLVRLQRRDDFFYDHDYHYHACSGTYCDKHIVDAYLYFIVHVSRLVWRVP
jgi:hypothetical protein